jgi:hypothetical protein
MTPTASAPLDSALSVCQSLSPSPSPAVHSCRITACDGHGHERTETEQRERQDTASYLWTTQTGFLGPKTKKRQRRDRGYQLVLRSLLPHSPNKDLHNLSSPSFPLVPLPPFPPHPLLLSSFFLFTAPLKHSASLVNRSANFAVFIFTRRSQSFCFLNPLGSFLS